MHLDSLTVSLTKHLFKGRPSPLTFQKRIFISFSKRETVARRPYLKHLSSTLVRAMDPGRNEDKHETYGRY